MRIYLAVAALLVASPALAQEPPTDNVPQAQSVCSIGYERALDEGVLRQLSSAEMDAADLNDDGNISLAEFNSACAKRVFKDAESAS